MYSETIESYSRKVWAEAYDAKEKIKQELKLKQIEDEDTLAQCLGLIEKLRETMCNCSGWLESFLGLKAGDQMDQVSIEWAEATLKSLCRFEFALLDMYEECSPDPKAVSQIIPVTWEYEEGITTIDIEYAMPHKRNGGFRTCPTLAYLLDEAFKEKIGEVPEHMKTDKAYIFIEHHINRDIEELQKRDCDNYDTKHLIDLAARYYLKYGDGPDYVKYAQTVIEDDHYFTRICIVKPNAIDIYVDRKMGFFSPS